MRLEHHIEELLYRYNCVIVPEFGAFLSQTKSAFIDQDTHTFYPPSKFISFNELLTSNDGLLVSYVADIEKASYETMLTELATIGKNWKTQLQRGERLFLGNIGKLWLNKEGKIQFEPFEKVNFLTTSFGLSSCVSGKITREVLKEEVVKLEEEIPFIITPEQRAKHSFRPYLKYAAVIFFGISLGLSGLRFYKENQNIDQLVHQDAQKQVSKKIEEATFFDASPLELPVVNLHASLKTPIAATQYHIVAGAFKVKENADKKIEQLQSKGYNANYIGVNKFGFHVVAFDSFSEANDAINYLRKIKQTESSDAWLFQE